MKTGKNGQRRQYLSGVLTVTAVLLLFGSALGSSRAAQTYISNHYDTQIRMHHIGIALLENGRAVSYRTYEEETDSWREENAGLLLGDLEEDGKKGAVIPGKFYPEELQVSNTGSIDTYVRVILYRSWQDGSGEKRTDMDPALLYFTFAESGWTVDSALSTRERIVLYYTSVLAPGESTESLMEGFTVAADILQTAGREDARLVVEAEADAVQARMGADAIKSAWGVEAEIGEDGSLRIIQGE